MELTYKGFIEDARNEKCSDAEVVKLSQIFAELLPPFAEVCAKKSWYDNACYEGIDGFSLRIEKTKSDEKFDHYTGNFKSGEKNLKILAKVKKPE